MKTISLKISGPLDGWLEAESRKLRRSKSEIVRETLESRRKGKASLTPSIHDIMKDVCGAIKGAPRDLSTNKKYLEDLGRERRSS